MQNSIRVTLIVIAILSYMGLTAQPTIQYTMPEETEQHEGTWLQWPHNHLYGPWYRDDVEPTWVAMTDELQAGEKVHIIAYDAAEQAHIISMLTNAGVPLTNVDFFIHETDDVWVRDNGPMFVYDQNNDLALLDWGFNGWGGDTPYSKCDIIPQSVSTDIGTPSVDLNAMVLEGGAIEHDGHGTMIATRSSITHSSRNPTLSETQIEDYLTTYMGITKFIWLDGVYGQDITDQHIDGFVKFANDSTIVSMNNTDLAYWLVSPSEITIINTATNVSGNAYNIVTVPLTQNNVVTTYGNNLGFKGSYCNYYIGNDVVLVPTYNDPNDAVAINIIQGIYPARTVVGVDVRNIYEYGGMIHCVTQQQPVALNPTDVAQVTTTTLELMQNKPNPFSDLTTITFSINELSTVTLELYDVLGQKVKTIINSKTLTGEQSVVFDAAELENGIYFYTLTVNGQAISRKMIVSK
jgi:agmatine deiminase